MSFAGVTVYVVLLGWVGVFDFNGDFDRFLLGVRLLLLFLSGVLLGLKFILDPDSLLILAFIETDRYLAVVAAAGLL